MRSLAGHGVVGLVDGELEGVVTAETLPRVGNVTTDADDDTGLARFEVGNGVQMTFTRTSDSGGSEIDLEKRDKTYFNNSENLF